MTILEEIELFDLKEPSNIKYSRIRYPIGIQHLIEQYSLICNIDADKEVIFNNFNPTTRNNIKQIIKQNNVIVEFIENPSKDFIELFMSNYIEFAENKNSDAISNSITSIDTKIKKWVERKILIFSIAYSSDYPEYKIYHAHQTNKEKKIARLMCSISCFRNQDIKIKNLIGCLNRYLHYSDFLKFKEMGYKTYDLGGIDINHRGGVETERIAQFKFYFSKKIIKYYYAIYPHECKISDKKKILITYNNPDEYNIALNIINQLSDKYTFYVGNSDLKSNLYDYIHYLSKNELSILNYLYNPYEFYYMQKRIDGPSIAYFDAIQSDYNSNEQLCLNLNKYDAVICKTEKEIVLAIACGCFVLTDLKNEFTNSAINKNNGIIFDVDTSEYIEYCKNHIKNIRNNALKNSIDIINKYSFFCASETINEFYKNEIKKNLNFNHIIKRFVKKFKNKTRKVVYKCWSIFD